MRSFGEFSGSDLSYNARLYLLNVKTGRTMDTSSIRNDLLFLVAALPNYWMEVPFGRSPGGLVAAMRRSRS